MPYQLVDDTLAPDGCRTVVAVSTTQDGRVAHEMTEPDGAAPGARNDLGRAIVICAAVLAALVAMVSLGQGSDRNLWSAPTQSSAAIELEWRAGDPIPGPSMRGDGSPSHAGIWAKGSR